MVKSEVMTSQQEEGSEESPAAHRTQLSEVSVAGEHVGADARGANPMTHLKELPPGPCSSTGPL